MNAAVIPKSGTAASISRDAALPLIASARAAAADNGIHVAIAVVDAGGYLVAFERSDKAAFLTAEVAIDKAWTAASFGLGTHTWNDIVRHPKVPPLAYRDRLMTVGGGVAIRRGDDVIGALGIAGGAADDDQRAAKAALRAQGFETEC